MIYFIQAGNNGPIKIGIAKNPSKRLSQLQVGATEELRLLGVMNGTEQHENDIHHQFAVHRVRGEWFSPTPELLTYIATQSDTLNAKESIEDNTWAKLVKSESRLLDLLQEAKATKDDKSKLSFCAHDYWYREDGLRDRLYCLVGWEAEKWYVSELRTSEAFDIAYDKIYESLPNCRNCSCV
jgi:hypothetical protein